MKMQVLKHRSQDALIDMITTEFTKTKDLCSSFEAMLKAQEGKEARTREEAEFVQAVKSILDLQSNVKAEQEKQ